MSDQLSLRYSGARVDEGRMDAYEVAAAIMAFSDFLGRTSRHAYGDKVELTTEIQGFHEGSFDIQFAIELAGATATVLNLTGPPTPADLIQLGREVLGLFQHLRGQPPKSITESNDKRPSLAVENQQGQIQYITADVVNIISDSKVGESARGFIGKPLSEGVSRVDLVDAQSRSIFTTTDDDADCYQPLDIERPVNEYRAQMGLMIEAPVFKEGNKWKFFDGQTSFWADIEDEDFLRAVNEGKRFGKGDWLVAEVRVEQTSGLNSLHAKRAIEKVLEHKARPEQSGFGFSH